MMNFYGMYLKDREDRRVHLAASTKNRRQLLIVYDNLPAMRDHH